MLTPIQGSPTDSFLRFNDQDGNQLVALHKDGTVSAQGVRFADGTEQTSAASGGTSESIIPSTVTSFNVYGDSIDAGYTLPNPENGWFSLFSGGVGIPIANFFAVPGDRISDIGFTKAYQESPSASVASLLIPGANDLADCTSNVLAIPEYVSAVEAMLVWLGIPNTAKVLTSGMTFAGTWSQVTYPPTITSDYSNSAGSTATFSIAGKTIYLGFFNYSSFGSGVSFKVTIDGVLQGTYSFTNYMTVVGGYPACLRFSNLTSGSHTVVITAVSGGAYATISWAAGISGAQIPLTIVGDTIPNTDDTDDIIPTMNADLDAMIATLQGDGLNIIHVADYSSLSLTATPVQYFPDNVHPNILGSTLLAAAWLDTVYPNSNQTANAVNQAFLNLPPWPANAGTQFGGTVLAQFISASGELVVGYPANLVSAPSTSSSTGTPGMIAMASGFLYICVATNTWQRVAIATF